MNTYMEIEKVIGREILDSRGNPTVEAEITLADGTVAEEQHQAELLPANLKRWSFGMETRADTAERACKRQ